ncbi:translation initiation factor IF-2-like [Aquila chrysaetos chrysaetos]|uniref:translation initiation factor IF-2-like n=1 Tax=Aquila chrysaetos chrysaetos TaxID=223781 RepID=UPI00117706D9|nr:translation initiation factor IF-2-like [Aquila chrysaetos chrysaetos]
MGRLPGAAAAATATHTAPLGCLRRLEKNFAERNLKRGTFPAPAPAEKQRLPVPVPAPPSLSRCPPASTHPALPPVAARRPAGAGTRLGPGRGLSAANGGRAALLGWNFPLPEQSVSAAASRSVLPHSSHQGAGRNPYRWGEPAEKPGGRGGGQPPRWDPAPAGELFRSVIKARPPCARRRARRGLVPRVCVEVSVQLSPAPLGSPPTPHPWPPAGGLGLGPGGCGGAGSGPAAAEPAGAGEAERDLPMSRETNYRC